jgi:hypothetical protein
MVRWLGCEMMVPGDCSVQWEGAPVEQGRVGCRMRLLLRSVSRVQM